MEARKVASVFASREDMAISRLLLDAGWHSEVHESAFDDCHVGLACLSSGDAAWLTKMHHTVASHRRIPWIAIVGPESIERDAIREFIALHCIDYQTLPLDRQRMLAALGHAAGMARLVRPQMCDGAIITPHDLCLEAKEPDQPMLNLDAARFEAEKNTLLAALRHTEWNARKSADLMGVSRATFYRLLERHGLAAEHSATIDLHAPFEVRVDTPAPSDSVH
jgi:DNA-binding NtrC family response regulator